MKRPLRAADEHKTDSAQAVPSGQRAGVSTQITCARALQACSRTLENLPLFLEYTDMEKSYNLPKPPTCFALSDELNIKFNYEEKWPAYVH